MIGSIQALNLLAGAALAGMMVWEAVIILPIVQRMPPAEGLGALRLAGRRAWRIAPVCGVTELLTGIALVTLLPSGGLDANAWLTIAGLAALLSAGLITFGPYVLADKRLRAIGAHQADPAGADAALSHLARLHALRTVFYVLAAAAFAAATAVT